MQEVYCRLLGGGRRRRHFRGDSEAQLMTYLQRVAASVVVDARRRSLAEKRWGGQRVAWAEWKLAPAVGVPAASGPDDRLFADERRRAFLALCRQALGRRATPTTVRIARLALLEGWSSREIARGLAGGMGIAGVDSVIYRLRRNLARRGIELPRRDRLPGSSEWRPAEAALQSPLPPPSPPPIAHTRDANQAAPSSGITKPAK